jgi:hypothetical protein
MKPFKINRNSWHYKLNKFFIEYEEPINHWEANALARWEARHTNFCSYWRATIIKSIVATLLAAIGIIILTALGISIYENFIEFATAIILVATTVTVIFGGSALIRYSIDRFKNRSAAETPQKPEGLFAQRYRAYKSRICPMIEYDK